MASLVGQTLGQYKLTRLIGEGGMAAVYQATQESMNREVAIKVIKPNMVDMEKFVERFALEARTVASLSHAHILKVFDYGHHEDIVYLVMEYLTGGSLEQLIESGPLTVEHTTAILDQIAGALDYAHGKGIIHRDLKPDNVLLDESGNAFLTDFGLAKILNASQKLTQTGATLGTPSYMAPEQWRGQPADARTDVYALGVMLFEMLTGNLPFNADSALSFMYQHIHEFPPLLTSHNPNIPVQLEDVLERALAKDPDDRFQSAGQLADEFRAALGKEPSSSVKRAPGTGSQPAAKVSGVSRPSGSGRQSAAKPPSGSTRQSPAAARAQTKVPPASRSPLLWLWGILAVLAVVVIGIMITRAVNSRSALVPTLVTLLTESETPAQNLDTPIAQTMAARNTATAQAIASFTATPTATATDTATATPSATATVTQTPTITSSPTSSLLPIVMPSIADESACQNGPQQQPGNNASREQMFTLSGHTGTVNSIAFSPDRKMLASGSSDKTARLWNIESRQVIQTFTGHKDAVYRVAFSPNGMYLLTGGADNVAILWEIATGEQVRVFSDFNGAVTSVAFSCDGKYALTSSADQSIKLWDVQTATLTRTFSGAHTLPVVDAVFSPNGRLIASASEDTTAVVWNMDSGAVQYTLKGHTATVHRVAFSRDGSLIITGSADGTAKVWDVATGRLVATLENSKQAVFAVSFTPDGREVLIGGKDGLVKAFNPRNGQLLHNMTQPTAAITDIKVMDIFAMIATAAADNSIRLWYLAPPPGGRP